MRLTFWLAAGVTMLGGYLLCRELGEGDTATLSPERPARRVGPPVKRVAAPQRPAGPGRRLPPDDTALQNAPLEKRLVSQVAARPGILQTELYALFPAVGRKHLQRLLLRLERRGALKRVPEKGTYRLLPAG